MNKDVEEDPPQQSLLAGERALVVELGARFFDQLVIDDAAGAGGFAAATVKAEIQMFPHRRRRFNLTAGQTQHELDAAAR